MSGNSYFIYFRGVLPSSENWGVYQNNYPWLVCVLALNATKELEEGRGGRGVELVINAVYVTRHVTYSIIY